MVYFKFESLNLRSMLKNIVCSANGLNPEFLEKEQIGNAFRQRIEF